MKKTKIICKYCKKIMGTIKTIHGLNTHSTCNKCQEIQNEIWK